MEAGLRSQEPPRLQLPQRLREAVAVEAAPLMMMMKWVAPELPLTRLATSPSLPHCC